jgi:hypothetical protein
VVLLLRFSISQMDVPTRQSYTLAVVDPDERSAAAGITGIARTVGASLAQLFAAPLYASAIAAAPFVISGGLKIVYDLLLYRDEVIDEPGLTVPHPRLHERRFVLEPLAELAPGLVVPGRGDMESLLRGVH